MGDISLLVKGNSARLTGLIIDLCGVLWVTVPLILRLAAVCLCNSHSNELTYMLSAVKNGNTPPIHLRMGSGEGKRRIWELGDEHLKGRASVPSKAW